MSQALQVTKQAPGVLDAQAFAVCIDAAFACAQSCMSCADLCLAVEDSRLLIRAVRLTGDCADICVATGWMLSREPHPDPVVMQKQIEACARTCQECAEECTRLNPLYSHCRACAAACRRSVEACLDALRLLARRR